MTCIKILVVGLSYNLYDEYIGKPILKGIEQLDAVPICSDAVDLKQAQEDSLNICKSVPWIMSRELLGSIAKYHNDVDGIILLTAFPCGPDSMINEMIIRPDQRPTDSEPAAGQPGRKCPVLKPVWKVLLILSVSERRHACNAGKEI